MKAQESVVSDDNMSWTALTMPIYMDMIKLVSQSLSTYFSDNLPLIFTFSFSWDR